MESHVGDRGGGIEKSSLSEFEVLGGVGKIWHSCRGELAPIPLRWLAPNVVHGCSGGLRLPRAGRGCVCVSARVAGAKTAQPRGGMGLADGSNKRAPVVCGPSYRYVLQRIRRGAAKRYASGVFANDRTSSHTRGDIADRSGIESTAAHAILIYPGSARLVDSSAWTRALIFCAARAEHKPRDRGVAAPNAYGSNRAGLPPYVRGCAWPHSGCRHEGRREHLAGAGRSGAGGLLAVFRQPLSVLRPLNHEAAWIRFRFGWRIRHLPLGCAEV